MLVLIIGAGIVGLHIATSLHEAGHEVWLLEKEPFLAHHSSGRNSGVIHAGIFYKPGSLKERLCLEGNALTYEWLKKLQVPFLPCGKFVVPEPGQEGELEGFFEKIKTLPIGNASLLSPEEVRAKEPHLRPLPAIFLPSTGILDAGAYVQALGVYVENSGVKILRNCDVEGTQGNRVLTHRGELTFDLGINCAGLRADEIAEAAGLKGYEVRPCRGDYYLLGRATIERPVYHLPYAGNPGLGVHLTPTWDGQTLLGPNAFFIEEKEDYRHRSEEGPFKKALGFYLPEYSDANIQAAYSGNRPKLFFKGKAIEDFTVIKQGPWVHCLGIESPGLTAAPALAKFILNEFI